MLQATMGIVSYAEEGGQHLTGACVEYYYQPRQNMIEYYCTNQKCLTYGKDETMGIVSYAEGGQHLTGAAR